MLNAITGALSSFSPFGSLGASLFQNSPIGQVIKAIGGLIDGNKRVDPSAPTSNSISFQ